VGYRNRGGLGGCPEHIARLSAGPFGFDFFLRVLFVFRDGFPRGPRRASRPVLRFEQQLRVRQFRVFPFGLLFARERVFLALFFGAGMSVRGVGGGTAPDCSQREGCDGDQYAKWRPRRRDATTDGRHAWLGEATCLWHGRLIDNTIRL
jgi:hypothetical protein